MYCLVVTDDYSRFTWVFFLATKDETSGILKSFITRIENIVDHKVKVIRCDNGTEFKNREMNQFCEIKGKFDGKADEGYFVGYSLNTKAFSVFNTRTRIVEENLHIRFSKNTPNVIGSGPDWLFNIEALTRTMNYEPIIADSKSSRNDGSKPLSDDGKKVDEDLRKESEFKDQEKEDNVNNTNNVNTVSSTVNAAGTNELPFDPDRPGLEDISTFNFLSNHEDDGEMADVNNLNTTIQIKEEVYVCQPPGFKDPNFPDRVYKVEKALYGLHQALKAWSMIGSLMYLTSSRLDIMFVVYACARYQINLKVSHLLAVKKIS
nr:putative ribonuclease H-like domain-containing protein [Tanacetum cinerariifolium]